MYNYLLTPSRIILAKDAGCIFLIRILYGINDEDCQLQFHLH